MVHLGYDYNIEITKKQGQKCKICTKKQVHDGGFCTKKQIHGDFVENGGFCTPKKPRASAPLIGDLPPSPRGEKGGSFSGSV